MAEILAITDQLFAVMKYGLESQKMAIRTRSTPAKRVTAFPFRVRVPGSPRWRAGPLVGQAVPKTVAGHSVGGSIPSPAAIAHEVAVGWLHRLVNPEPLGRRRFNSCRAHRPDRRAACLIPPEVRSPRSTAPTRSLHGVVEDLFSDPLERVGADDRGACALI